MILTKEQAEKRVSSEVNIVNQLAERESQIEIKVIDKNKGNNQIGKPGAHNLTQEERVEAVVMTKLVGNEAAAQVFGITEKHATNLATYSVNNTDNNTRRIDTDLKEKVEERLERAKFNIQEIAAEKLLKVFNCLDDDKIANSSAKEIAQIASQVSQVVRNLTPREKFGQQQGNVKIILQQPKASREEHFEVIEVKVG